jgi:hypothetical protein
MRRPVLLSSPPSIAIAEESLGEAAALTAPSQGFEQVPVWQARPPRHLRGLLVTVPLIAAAVATAFVIALAAAAARGHFWALTRELLQLRHDDPVDLHAALLRAGLDPERTLDAMRAGTGADRIVADVASALASGVAFSPALFVNGRRYDGELDDAAAAVAAAAR